MNPSAYGWKKQYFIQQQPIFIGALLQIVQNELIKPYIYKYRSLVEHSENSPDIITRMMLFIFFSIIV